MQISKTNNNPNFTSVYRIKNANIDDFRKAYVSSFLLNMREQKSVSMFCGNNPFESIYRTYLQAFNNKSPKLYNSVVKHFEKLSIKLPQNDTFDIWIFDGRDHEVIGQFVKKYKNIASKDLLINGVYRGERTVSDIEANVIKVNSKNNSYTSEFRNKFNKGVIEFNSVKDWLTSMINRKG